ncbi:MAG: nicotinate-nucleotide adenylyltransferase [Flavobacteriaceae bacterium]|nr:nicotinate-nucleotide adenylyltransferase [Bacteroidia bacterium]NNL16690.1 nicotinate-nucleotide adenylyltransferase [Flavobacteriaceae bacterium]
MKKLVIGLLIFGLATQFMFAQVVKPVELSEVVVSVNYKYLDAIDSKEVAVPVKLLEEKVAYFNLKESELYSDEYDTYQVSFFIPEGKIVAAYDQNGKILRTIERFKNIKLPKDVVASIVDRFPKWRIVEDAYKVDYYGKSGIAKKQYKVKLKNKDKKMVVKLDEDGEFL